MKIRIIIIIALLSANLLTYGQDTTKYRFRFNLPLTDLPQNYSLPYNLPSMNQSMECSYDFYELAFGGIDVLGDKIFVPRQKNYTRGRKVINTTFKYALGLVFSKYGSELPIPLGVWGHEEFHRATLGTAGVASKNGNWLFSRWDGTVYGIADQSLVQLKNEDPQVLLYSYVAGVQYETALNQKVSLNDFYKSRTLNKTALLLYNAWYVYDYFRFATSALSDSVKVLAPPHESPDPIKRDYAGADLTAWAYDMFNPTLSFDSRDSFPNGDGVNRRVGFSELTQEAQTYLKHQKNLSLLNFLNPSIFFINKISLNHQLSFNFFAQYVPTHFGHDIAVYLPVKYRQFDLLLIVHNYANQAQSGFGIGAGLYNYKISEKFESDADLYIWNQPDSFYGSSSTFGGQLSVSGKYYFLKNFSAYASICGKTRGWIMENPYLEPNISFRLGLNYYLAKK